MVGDRGQTGDGEDESQKKRGMLDGIRRKGCRRRNCAVFEAVSRSERTSSVEALDRGEISVSLDPPASRRKLLGEMCAGSCDLARPCRLKDLFLRSPYEDHRRTMAQIKVILLYHAALKRKRGAGNVDLRESSLEFVLSGRASKFAALYDPEIPPDELYKRINRNLRARAGKRARGSTNEGRPNVPKEKEQSRM